jgi:hypothetical protein
MNFSSILDISSFFIGMIINLILVSLMCYYFKRKYEILESAQTEQAKILYELLRRDSPKKPEIFKTEEPRVDYTKGVDYTKDPLLNPRVIDSDSEDSGSESSDSEYEIEVSPGTPPGSPSGSPLLFSVELSQEIIMDELKAEELIIEPIESLDLGEVETQVESKVENVEVPIEKDTKEIVIDQIILDSPESNYNKMSIKQLKDILTSKGVKPKHNMKKDELVDLVKDIEHEVSI